MPKTASKQTPKTEQAAKAPSITLINTNPRISVEVGSTSMGAWIARDATGRWFFLGCGCDYRRTETDASGRVTGAFYMFINGRETGLLYSENENIPPDALLLVEMALRPIALRFQEIERLTGLRLADGGNINSFVEAFDSWSADRRDLGEATIRPFAEYLSARAISFAMPPAKKNERNKTSRRGGTSRTNRRWDDLKKQYIFSLEDSGPESKKTNPTIFVKNYSRDFHRIKKEDQPRAIDTLKKLRSKYKSEHPETKTT